MNKQIHDDAKCISAGIEDWLAREIVNSDNGRNEYLSHFDERRKDLLKSFDIRPNHLASKAEDHYNRFAQFLNGHEYFDLGSEDKFAARLIFECMMNISGSYRKQCILESENSDDYADRRAKKSFGIDLLAIVTDELSQDTAGMSKDESIARLIKRSREVNIASLELHMSIHNWSIEHGEVSGSIAAAEAEPVKAMLEAQRLWAGLAVAHIALAAICRGEDLAKVPLLEPKSITDAEIIEYPFAS